MVNATELAVPNESLRLMHSNFLKELRDANSAYLNHGENRTSLPFIVSSLPNHPLVSDGEVFQAISLGGSIGKSALVRKGSQGLEVLSQGPDIELPPLRNEQEFMGHMEEMIDKNVKVVGINAAMVLEPVSEDGKLDGVLVSVEDIRAMSARDLVGKRVGKSIEAHLQSKGRNVVVSVGGDTVCLLLSGKNNVSGDNLACGVVGTGLNFGLLLDRNTAVNLESAEFDKFDSSEVGKILGESRMGSPFGREVNGRLLFMHFNHALTQRGVNFAPLSSTEELDKVSRMEIPIVSDLAQNVLKRSAQLVAVQVAGIADFKEEDTTFVMEGSLFWKGNSYKDTVEQTANQLTKRKVDFMEIPNSGIVGAANLVS